MARGNDLHPYEGGLSVELDKLEATPAHTERAAVDRVLFVLYNNVFTSAFTGTAMSDGMVRRTGVRHCSLDAFPTNYIPLATTKR